MSSLIEHYGYISNLRGSALVSRDGSIDWLCLPNYDSDSCFTSLLGHDEDGAWHIQPAVHIKNIRRRYRSGTLVLETDFECEGGAIRLVDFMPVERGANTVIRIVEGLRGEVPVWFKMVTRFGYGKNVPWITKESSGFRLMVAPNSLSLHSTVPLTSDGKDIRGEFVVRQGQTVAFELTWQLAHLEPPAPIEFSHALRSTVDWWKNWSGKSTYKGAYADAVNSSLIFLKGMTYSPTGAIAAAPTTSLPEQLGGPRNWDYRFCWLRDASLTVKAFLAGGYTEEAEALRQWIIRIVAGDPADTQIMYGLRGEMRLTEYDVPWLSGYESSMPVRIGNAASEQFQLDVFGEAIGTMYHARERGLKIDSTGTGATVASKIMEYVAKVWERPDDGIWEVRGGRKHFVYSKVMAWVAVDSFIKLVEMNARQGRQFPVNLSDYRVLRDRIHRDVCERGFNTRMNSFTAAYDTEALDASLLNIPLWGFLPIEDPRVQGTIRAVEKNLMREGFMLRYDTQDTNDGLPGEEGAFLACSFWLVTAHARSGRRREAEELFERLLSLRNDLGLLAEEYDHKRKRLIGNFPQAFSHLALIEAAEALTGVREHEMAAP
jgi:GH15 family glucan-1,4-alpha-glucosidase